MKIALPGNVKRIINILNKGGFSAYAVGGCVRDSLLSKEPNDWDITTSAPPQTVKALFSSYTTFDSGIKHGTVSVVIDKVIYEITTYRIDGEYKDNRRPDAVTFTDDITKDLARRDFTVNAIAYNEQYGIIDPFGGLSDLKENLLRCVGNPDERFKEDALRIIRALRFASVYSLRIEQKTSDAILRNRSLLKNIASERIREELLRLLTGDGAENILLSYRDVFAVFIPEAEPMFDFEQHTKHHNRDVWAHTAHAVAVAANDPLIKTAMLFHDIAKPLVCKRDLDGTTHFKKHPVVSAAVTNRVLQRLRFPSDFTEDCTLLVKYHDVRYNGSKKQILRLLNILGERRFRLLLKIQLADTLSQSEYLLEQKLKSLTNAESCLNEVIYEDSCFSMKHLAVNGNDLLNIGCPRGKAVGATLKFLLNCVIDGKVKNEKPMLIQKAQDFINTIPKE